MIGHRPLFDWRRMRFSCDQCQTRYTIADEKVRGKLLRVRCKRCGSTILLRESIPPEASFTSPSDEDATHVIPSAEVKREIAAKSSPPRRRSAAIDEDRPHWYAALDGKEIGPLNEQEVRSRIAAGALTERSHVWRDGLPDWTRLRDVPLLAAMLVDAPTLSKIDAARTSATRRKRHLLLTTGAAVAVILALLRAYWTRDPAHDRPIATTSLPEGSVSAP